ncbi:MAG: DUF6119 family protein [Bacteroidota bacterium]
MTAIKPTIYLIKESITDPKKIFRKDSKLSSVTNNDVSLFYVKSKSYSPEWANFVTDNFEIEGNPFKNSSSRAVIVIKLAKRMAAIPLGLGVHFLDLSKTDYNFGLKTALNCIPKSAVRQIDTTTPELNSQKTKKQAAVGTTPEELGINKQKDILRGVTGKLPNDHKLGKSVDGKDSLRVSASVENIEKLKSLCEKALTFYEADTYKKDYSWIDNIALVRDASLIDKLDKELAKNLKNARFGEMFFVPPVFYETVFDHQGFAFSSSDGSRLSAKELYEMPDMADWKSSMGDARAAVTVENLETYRVILVGDDKHSNQAWPLQRCLAWETMYAGEKYILSEGSWYNVASDFFKEVNDFYLNKLIVRKELPKPSKIKIKESDYNFEISKSGADMYLFDLGHDDGRDKSIGADQNEACDVYSAGTSTFYHVKMGKASSTISHLFRQGAFSGQILKRDENVCNQFRKHLIDYGCKAGTIPIPYVPAQYQIAFVLVLGASQKKDIPFFSKVSFKDVVQNELEMLGYQCTISFVGGR